MNRDTPSLTPFAQFSELFAKETDVEKKLRMALDFMRMTLSQSETPRFKDFWEAKRLALPLFKENLSAKTRSLLWAEYHELSSEAKRIKEILDEQASFAIEQIDLALKAIEEEIAHLSDRVAMMPELVIPEVCHTFYLKRDLYNQLQRELNFLNTLAIRIQTLRKELMKTEMRIRDKNRLFERLSTTGDAVFPRRKELIQKISEEFKADVERFVSSHKDSSPFALREEIKACQALAKELTLNSQAFTETRLKLSSSWDKLKEEAGERRKEVAEKKQQDREKRQERQAREQAREEERRAVEEQKLSEQRARLEKIADLLSKKSHESVDELEAVLDEARDEREKIREKLEQLRKSVGISNLDFEKAIWMQEQLAFEKEHLEKINHAIEQLEEKIDLIQ